MTPAKNAATPLIEAEEDHEDDGDDEQSLKDPPNLQIPLAGWRDACWNDRSWTRVQAGFELKLIPVKQPGRCALKMKIGGPLLSLRAQAEQRDRCRGAG